jgi:hypothetical protein
MKIDALRLVTSGKGYLSSSLLAALPPAQALKQVLFPRHFQNQEALEMKEKCFADVHLPKKSTHTISSCER